MLGNDELIVQARLWLLHVEITVIIGKELGTRGNIFLLRLGAIINCILNQL
jgi:hypothetical protein